MKKNLLLPLTLASVVFGALSGSAAFLIDENFDSYSDGALVGQGEWAQAANFNNNNDRIQVAGGAAYWDWASPETGETHGARLTWGTSSDSLESGSVFALFNFRVSQAPVDSENLRPSFFAFANSLGNQERGQVGLQPGGAPDTFQIGVASNSQHQSAFTFSPVDLNINETYQVMVEYQIDPGNDTIAQVWLNTTDPLDEPAAVSVAGGSSTNIRRVNLRMNNQDGDGGATDLGIFTLDDLQVTTVPEPSHYALFFGVSALLFLAYRRRRS